MSVNTPAQPQLYDPQGKPISLSPEEIPDAIRSGKAAFLKSEQVPVMGPDGKPATVSGEDAPTAFDRGYQYEPLDSQVERAKEAKYGEGIGNEALAGLAGAARGASLGLSDLALTKSGAVDPETLEALRKYNPTSSLVGEVAGVAAPAFLTDGVAAEFLPSSLASQAGGAVAERVAGAIGSEGAQSLAKRIVGTAISKGAGSAVEGALYGAGTGLSESLLGDTDSAGETILAHAGMGAILGGALGSALGLGEGALSKPFAEAALSASEPEILPAASEALSPEEEAARYGSGYVPPERGTLEHAVDQLRVPSESKQSIIEGLQKRKENAPEILQAAKNLDAPVLESQISASEHVQKLDQMLMTSPDPIGVARQQLAAQGIEKAEKAVSSSLGEGTDLSIAEVGEQLKKSLSDKLQGEAEPISQLYDELKEHYEAIPLNPKSVQAVARNIRNLEGVKLSPKLASMAEDFASRLEGIGTVDELKQLKSVIHSELSPTASALEKRAVSQVSEKLSNMEENTILGFAKNTMKTPEAKERIQGLLDQREAANTAYKALRDKMGELGDVLGKRKIQGPQDFLNFIDETTPEKFAQKLFAKNNSQFLQYFAKNFPDETRLLMQYQRGAIRNASMVDGHVMMNKVFRELDKLSPELKKIMFNEQERKLLDAAQTYMESMPKNFNPSGTSSMEAYRRFFTNPVSATVETLKSATALKSVKSLVGLKNPAEEAKLTTLMKLEELGKKFGNSIQSNLKGFVNGTKAAAIDVAAHGTPESVNYIRSSQLDDKGPDRARKNRQEFFQRRYDEISKVVSDPETLVNRVSDNLAPLHQLAPKVSQALTDRTIRAAQFLYEKAPKDPGAAYAMSPWVRKWHPSDAQIAQWERYVTAVDHPMSLLKDLRNGMLTSESVEAMKTVYPKMYQQVVSTLTDHLSELREELPYQKRLQLSLLFGVPIDQATDPSFIAQMQAIHAQASGAEAQQGSTGINMSGASKMQMADSAKTETERVITRS